MSAAESARLLVDFYFAHPVGHVIEALRYALGYHRANPDLRISLVLNGSAPTELAGLVQYVETAYAVGGCLDFLHGGDARQAIAHIPRDWAGWPTTRAGTTLGSARRSRGWPPTTTPPIRTSA